MGQGQEVHARRLVQQSVQDGSWVLLHNCHLGLDYMDELLDTIVSGDSIQSSFRLWLTTEVHPQFPINFLQVSVACTCCIALTTSCLIVLLCILQFSVVFVDISSIVSNVCTAAAKNLCSCDLEVNQLTLVYDLSLIDMNIPKMYLCIKNEASI